MTNPEPSAQVRNEFCNSNRFAMSTRAIAADLGMTVSEVNSVLWSALNKLAYNARMRRLRDAVWHERITGNVGTVPKGQQYAHEKGGLA